MTRFWELLKYVFFMCGLAGAGKALLSFPKWELFGLLAFLVFYAWYSNFHWSSYGVGLLFGFAGGVQVGKRIGYQGGARNSN